MVKFETVITYTAVDITGVCACASNLQSHSFNYTTLLVQKAISQTWYAPFTKIPFEPSSYTRRSANQSSPPPVLSLQSAPLRLAPAAYPEDSLTKSTLATSNSFGVHDTMRHGVRSIQSEVLPGHPLEQRLKHVR
ncbi:hypothetical protein BC938DRAFT_480061 [Jimgerdemannia flammicorona]|uniref:Uncharacterized protein n=1 Tax=Jimgerdemannia flammicorona TaxID=994334 RepID=A0A433QJI9_9FUNG|nr:hypothetical protein BC938DRAFT_480061 [Jimgerdemannia flammicorona]